MKKYKLSIMWFRRDLRLTDNAALHYALENSEKVLCVFIFDKDILKYLHPEDKRLAFIYSQLKQLNIELSKFSGALLVLHDSIEEAFNKLLTNYRVNAIFCNRDYEPYAINRDQHIFQLANAKGVSFKTFKDQVIFEQDDILKNDQTPFVQFTAYKNAWLKKFSINMAQSYSIKLNKNCFIDPKVKFLELEDLGFLAKAIIFSPIYINHEIINTYHLTRDLPFDNSTTLIGIHLRFGTVSIRELVKFVFQLNATFLNQLIWREFFMMILYKFPHVQKKAFKLDFEHFPYESNTDFLNKWQSGQTGYPFVDAAMRQLVSTGFMPNRLRMVTASFLCKHLMISYKEGEAFFARYLLDFDLAANNGGWQWTAGCGVDASPYYRIFNPVLQAEKFDPNSEYIKRWVPEFESSAYKNQIIVDHKSAFQKAMLVYKEFKQLKHKSEK